MAGVAARHESLIGEFQSMVEGIKAGMKQKVDSLHADPSKPPSSSQQAAQQELDEFTRTTDHLLQQMQAQVKFEKQAAQNTTQAKNDINDIGSKAMADIANAKKRGSLASGLTSAIGGVAGILGSSTVGNALTSYLENEAKEKFKKDSSSRQQSYASGNQDLYSPPLVRWEDGKIADGDDSGPLGSGTRFKQVVSIGGQDAYKQAGNIGGQDAYKQAGNIGGQDAYKQAGNIGGQDAYKQQSAINGQSSASTSAQSASNPTSSASSSGGSGASGGAATSLQSGAAVAEHGAAPVAPQGAAQSSGSGGGVGVPPSIGGIGSGGPAGGGGGQGSRIGGVGGGSEAPRTGVQGSGAAEKPAATPSSGSPGEQRGAGVSRAVAGAGGVGGETRAMSAQQAALRDALRTGDTAAGAGAYADKAAANQQILGTGLTSSLSGPSLGALTTRTQAAAGAWEALPDRFSARSPVLGAEDAQTLFGGGTLVGAAARGFDEKLVFRRLPLPDLGGYRGASFLLFVYEDYSTAPNPGAGVFRPVFSEVTSTEANGSLRPGFEVPEGVGVMDRSDKALSVASDAEADPGKLALYLAKWRLGLFESHATSWRPVAVGFLQDPGEGPVAGLAQLGVEAYWPGRGGYTMESEPAEDALVAGTGQVGAASSRADREAQAKFDEKGGRFGVPPGTVPDAPFDGAGLTGVDKASHDNYQRELGRSPTAKEYVEDRLARKRRPDGTVDDSFSF
ncbi:hypothetical protein [Segniliparus rotundus]|nr:hypothetical protein [Segniliparus rotundus]